MNRPARVILGGAAIAAIAAALALLAFWSRPGSHTFYTDGQTIHEPAGDAPVRSVLWEPAKPIDGPINTTEQEYEPRLSADGQTLFFVRGKAGRNADLFCSTRTAKGWSEPQPLPFNTGDDELGPAPSPDGQALYFYSNRPAGLGGYDIWVARRDGDGWDQPVDLGPSVNTEFNEYSPALSPDGSRLYFASNRPRPGEAPDATPSLWPATLRESFAGHDYDLYAVALEAGQPGKVIALTSLNTMANEGTPAVSPFGDFLYFSSDRKGGLGGLDLWRSRMLRNELQPPENLGPAINSRYNDLDPGLSLGGFAIYFSSDRPLATAATGDYNIYNSISHEVFKETESANYAALWSQLWPKLLWLLLSLLALLALILLIRGSKDRRLSILAKCLLASLAVHAAIMFMLNFWQVAGAVGQFLGQPGRARVHLTGGGGGVDALAGQIRGEVTTGEIALPDTSSSITAPVTLSSLEAKPLDSPAAIREISVPSDAQSRAHDSMATTEPHAPAATPDSAPSAVAMPAAGTPSATGEHSVQLSAATNSSVAPITAAPAANNAPSTALPVRAPAGGSLENATLADAAPALGEPSVRQDVPQQPDLAVNVPAASGGLATAEPTPSVAANPGATPSPAVGPAPSAADPGAGPRLSAKPVAVPSDQSLASAASTDAPVGGSPSSGPAPRLGASSAPDTAPTLVALPRDAQQARSSGSETSITIAAAPAGGRGAAPVPHAAAASAPTSSQRAAASRPSMGGSLASPEMRDASPEGVVSGASIAALVPEPTGVGGGVALPHDAAARQSHDGAGAEPSEVGRDLAVARGRTAGPRVAPQRAEIGGRPAGAASAATTAALGSTLVGGQEGVREAQPSTSPLATAPSLTQDSGPLAVRIPGSASDSPARSGEATGTPGAGSITARPPGLAPPVLAHGPADVPRVLATPVPVSVAPSPEFDPAQVSDAPSTGSVQVQAPPAPGATFFGVAAIGKRFAYICDISGSMHKRIGDGDTRRIDVLKSELATSLGALGNDSQFFVCLFSDDAAILEEKIDWTNASDDGKAWANRRMQEVEAEGDTRPLGAFQVVLSLDPKPDAIYFMTDGEFERGYVREIARLNEQWHIPIHCITFISQKGERLMQRIAEDSGGTYTHVPGPTGN